MSNKRCFVKHCMAEVYYACLCLSPEVYSCEIHIGEHLKVPKRTHNIVSVFIEPSTETKDAVVELLLKEKLKKEKLKKRIVSSFTQNLSISENSIDKSLRKLDSDLYDISSWIEKISQTQKISKFDEDPLLQLLSLEPGRAVEKVKEMIPAEAEAYNNVKYFCTLSKEIESMIENFIKNKFDAFLDKKLSDVERRLDENNKKINGNIENVNHSISKLILESKNNKNIIENLNQDIQQNIQNQIKSIQTQLDSALKLIQNKLSEMDHFESQINQSISNQLLVFHELQAEKSEILSRPINSPEIEQEFRRTCALYESQIPSYIPIINQVYQDYINVYHQNTSLYLTKIVNGKSNLIIYDTESEREDVKIFKDSIGISERNCIALLPNGKLFLSYCLLNLMGDHNDLLNLMGVHNYLLNSIWDYNYVVTILPLRYRGIYYYSSAIYFNRGIYCFGGYFHGDVTTTSLKFDLDSNHWTRLTELPEKDQFCHSIIINGNILISGLRNRHLLWYSIDNDSFTEMPYEFAAYKRKILINVGILYLIECDEGYIYESTFYYDREIRWEKIGNSIINYSPLQAYYTYNKGKIYIATDLDERYYKFDLNKKIMIKF